MPVIPVNMMVDKEEKGGKRREKEGIAKPPKKISPNVAQPIFYQN
jgi:hypothetical protein